MRSSRGFCSATTSLLALALLALGRWQTAAFVSYFTTSGQPEKWNLTNPQPLYAAGLSTNVINPTTRAVRYFLAADAYSTANKAAELNAARACFDQWQAVSNSILRFEEGGLATGTLDVNTSDNTNLVYWAKNSTIVNGGLDNIYGTTGITFSDFFSDGSLAEADIVLNAAQYTWFTDFNRTNDQGQFVEAVLLHEIGHFVGLAHSPVGCSTMFTRGGGGVTVQAGLSPDEIAAVHTLYPGAGLPLLAHLKGQVLIGVKPVFGAIVCAEDSAGNVAAGTVTKADGSYDLPALPPGKYLVRTSPVDPSNSSYALFRGADVAAVYSGAEANFLPSANTAANLTAGIANTLNFAVTAGTPLFRITRLWPPSTDASIPVVVNYASPLPTGESDVVVGVYSADVPSPSAVLRVTGDGLTNTGPTTIQLNAFPGVNPPLNLISVPIHVSAAATPGMRTIVVQQGTSFSYANGFLEVPTPIPDFNFDGLDDRFQRQYFARWTVPEAGPNADPDHDGFTNTAEYLAGTDPTDPNSVLRIQSVRADASGVTISWASAPGKRYQMLSRAQVSSSRTWQPLGDPVTADSAVTQFTDSAVAGGVRFYKLQAIP